MASDKIKPRSLPGFMELLPAKQVVFEDIKGTLEDVYSRYGFFPLDTPVLEHSEILLAKAGGETEKQIYQFQKGDTDLTMRFDLTVPLAKYVALNYGELTFPFKRYQIGKVYRGERAQKGRYREFYQADIDVVGDGELSVVNDAEIPSIIYDTFTTLGIEDFTIRINNRKVLSGFFSVLGQAEKISDILRSVDKLPKIGEAKVKAELALLGLDEATSAEIIGFVGIEGSNGEKLAAAEKYAGKDPVFDEGLTELRQVAGYIEAFGVPEKNFAIDYSIARGLDYYTGTVYETIVTAHPEIGSVCSGGRYDNLAGYYTDKKLPGVGISIGLTRLFYVLDAMNAFGEVEGAPADVLVIPMTEEIGEAIALSKAFRQAGVSAQVYLENKKFKKKMQYANKLHIPYVALLGEDEIAGGKVTLKRLADGEQSTIGTEEAIEAVKSQLCAAKGKIIQNMG